MNKDYYSILGLSKDASIGEIKTAYRKLAHKFHPDKNPGDPFFENMFREVNEAYNALITFKKGEPNSTKVHTNNPPPPSNENAKKPNSQYDNAIRFANQVEDQYRKIKWLEEDQVDKNKLTEYLNTTLTDRVINELKSIDHFDSNYRIIDTVTGMFQFLKKESVDEYSVKLANLAKSNNELNLLIYRKAKERSKELKNRKIWKYVKIIGAIAIITYFIHLYQEDSKSREQRTRENQSTSRPTLSNLDKPSTNSNPIPSKWKNNHLKTGDSPYNDHFGNGVYDKNYQNEITVKNGQTTDVIVCLTQYYPPKRTIRNEYIRAGDSFKMTNIPNGTYFIKSFYGKYWNPEIKVVGAAKGYFDTLAGFSKSDNYDDLLVMDQDEYHYSIYELTLYPVIGGNMESEPINLHEFFRE